MSFIIKAGVIKSSAHLKKSIEYILNEKKTQGLTCTNCGPPGAVPEAVGIYEEFLETKRLHPSGGGREGYHYKISFSKEESITPQDALQFVRDFAGMYLEEGHDFAASVHTDREHLHMHLVFNSTARTGGKFHFDRSHWKTMVKPIAATLAERYHTGGLKEKDPQMDYTASYDKESTKPAVSWRNLVEADIAHCMDQSKSYAQFKVKLRKVFGYKVREGVSREHGLYLALTPPGKAKAIRSYQLSAFCQPEAIDEELTRRKQGIYRAADDSFVMYSSRHFIPYREMTYTEKENVRRMLAAKRLYRRTGTSLQHHERSVKAIRGMQAQAQKCGVTTKKQYSRKISTTRYDLTEPKKI